MLRTFRAFGLLALVGAPLAFGASQLRLDTLPQSVQPGSKVVVTWTRTGHVPFVKLDYRYTWPSGNWVRIADSVPDTGRYVWTVPFEPEGLAKAASTVYSARLRIGGPDSVAKDSASFGVVFSVSIRWHGALGALSYSVPGAGEVLTGLPAGARIEILDLFGRSVAAQDLNRSETWNLRDARGARAPAGTYVLRARVGGKILGTAQVQLP